MNINEEIQKASDKVIAENLPNMVEKSTVKMLESIVSDIFSSYSPMAKSIKETIEKSLDINLQNFKLVDYNVIVANAVNSQLTECINENTLRPISELVKSAVGFIENKSIKLSTIHEIVIEASKEDDSTESEGEISFYAEKNDKYGWVTVNFDIEKGRSQNDCAIEFLISDSKESNIFCFNAKTFMSRKGNLTPSKLAGLSQLERQIFRLYSAQVKIEIDELDFENEWYRYND